MSTYVKLHVRTDDMTEEMLRDEGVLGGPLSQLMSSGEYEGDFTDALQDAPSTSVGSSKDDGVLDVADLFDVPTEVDDVKIQQTKATAWAAEKPTKDVVDWLKEHRGEEVFAIHW